MATLVSNSTYTSVTVYLNDLPTTLQHTAAAVTWQDRDALCIIPYDTASHIARHRLYAISQWYGDQPVHPHSTEPRQKKELNSNVTLMSTGP